MLQQLAALVFVGRLQGVPVEQREGTHVEPAFLEGEKVLAAAETHQQVAQVPAGVLPGRRFELPGVDRELLPEILRQ